MLTETSRIFATAASIPRICTEDYRFPDSDFVMKKGEKLIIPVYGLHMDSQYYPNPDVFNPENFSEKAKASRPSCCFLPFSVGPRNCIGMQFEFKKEYRIINNDETVLLCIESRV